MVNVLGWKEVRLFDIILETIIGQEKDEDLTSFPDTFPFMYGK